MKKHFAFTFIEILVAITVFAIGVLAVLRLITQNLVTLDHTQDRTTATFLAKEWIDLVYNMRDANIKKWLPWDCIMARTLASGARSEIDPDRVCIWYFTSGKNELLQLSFDPTLYLFSHVLPLDTHDFTHLWEQNRLYMTTWMIGEHSLFWYTSSSGASAVPTSFARYILFTGVTEWSYILPRDRILKVESHVLYVNGTSTGEVVLESLIGKY